MFEETYSSNYGEYYYKEFDNPYRYDQIMDLVRDSEKTVSCITFDDEADVGLQAFNGRCSLEEYYKIPDVNFMTVNSIVVHFDENHVIMSINRPEKTIGVETLEEDFTLDAFLCEKKNMTM